VDHYRIVQNNCLDYSSQVYLGKTSRGTEMWINREFMECDVHILTGFIEPHIFAGFSGYGKSVLPGMAGLKTIVTNHGYHNLKHPKATWGITWGNPNWEEIREVTLAIGNLFLLNVTLNKNKQITGVYAGDPDTAHSAGVEQVRQHAMVALPEPFDIVITTNSGYPLDLNLYQSIKGNSAAAQIIRPGGSIILAAECWDGIPEHGLYAKLLREAESPQSLLDEIGQPGYEKLDQWTVQLQAQIFTKADVYVRNDYLSDEQLRSVKFLPCHNIEEKAAELVEKIGPQARICVLPEGPQTIPYIEPVTV
jgi:nickel-dependent lactate racemase